MEHFVFLEPGRALTNALPVAYSPWLVLLSVIFAVVSSFTAFLIAEQIDKNNVLARKIIWIFLGSFVLGGGVWSMHFIGMLAIKLPVSVNYDFFMTVLSFLPIFIASFFVFLLQYNKKSIYRFMLLVSAVVGVGVVVMHYMGMSAMRVNVEMRHDPVMFVLSIVAAVSLAYSALYMKSQVAKNESRGYAMFSQYRIFAALIMGLAISAMHYIAMLGVYFFPVELSTIQQANLESELLINMVQFTVLILVLILTITIYFGKKFEFFTEIQLNESRIRSILDNVGEGVITIDENGLIKQFNLAAEHIFDYAQYDVLNKNINMLMPEPDRSQHDSYIKNFILTGDSKILGVSRRVFGQRKDGEKINIELTVTSCKSSGQHFFTGLVRDVTKEKETEMELDNHRKHLEELVAERTVALEAANKELETFSYTVSHDLRSPLRSINGFCHVLGEDYAESLGDDGKDILNRIIYGVRHMDELIDDLLSLSKVSSTDLEYENVDLTLITEAKILELKETDPLRNVEITVADNLKAKADKKLVAIVIDNLLGNSWKYTSKKPKAIIDVGECMIRGENVFYVKDNGAGFDMVSADKIFSAFQRLHNTNDFDGTGVGLATVQRIIHRHGGHIWADAMPDVGATFYFTFQPGESVLNSAE